MKPIDIVVRMHFGSHLYGTATENSDHDYKGIFLPEKSDLILGKRCKSISTSTKKGSDEKNTSLDVDEEIYSLHYFIELACKGETVAFDMLHAPDTMIIEKNWIWDELVRNRERFYTKNLKAFVGYARRQAAKYGIKGSRIAAAKKVLSIIDSPPNSQVRMMDVWHLLPESEHLRHVQPGPNGIRQYQVCGKILQETATTAYCSSILKDFLSQYGKRARMAERNEGVDWKAISHALRVAFRVREFFEDGTMTFPRPEAKHLLSIKRGERDCREVISVIEMLMGQIENLADASDLPTKVNRGFWDDFILMVYDTVHADPTAGVPR